MKKLVFIFTLLIGWMSVNGQNFLRLWDASGYQLSEDEIDSLESAVAELVLTLSDTIQSKFKVYDVGYYVHNESMIGSGSIESQWLEALSSINSDTETPYYLIMGRIMYSNGRKEIKIKLKLPQDDVFYCIDNISPGFREELNSRINTIANQLLESSGFIENEIAAIKELKFIIENKICCDTQNRGIRSESCNACLINSADNFLNLQGQTIYPSSQEFGRLLDKNFNIDFVDIVQDNEYFTPEDNPTFTNRDKGTRTSLAINATINFEGEGQASVDNLISEVNLAAGDIEVFLYKYPRDCGQFDDLWNQYTAYNGSAVFISLINVDRVNGILAYHQKVTPINNVHSPSSGQRSSSPNPTEDDLEGMREALEDADCVCWDALLAYGNVFQYNVSLVISKFALSNKDKKFYKEHYDKYKDRVYSAKSEGKAEYNYYYDMEWLIEKKKNNRWDWTASFLAHIHLCSEGVHGVLDMCGVIDPGGIVCDGANSILYFLKGDKINGSLSLTATIPLIGNSATATKISTKIAKTAAGSPASVYYRATIKAGTNFLHWTGGSGKLARVMAKAGGTPAFCKITDALNNSAREIHHLIPYSITDYKNLNRFLPKFNIKLQKAGWHPSNPIFNGMDIPKYFRGGETFHGIHENLINWVYEALVQLDRSNLEGQPLINKMEELAIFLRAEIVKAYGNGKSKASGGTGKSLHEHFRNLDKYIFIE